METPDAQIEVRGTAFRLSVGDRRKSEPGSDDQSPAQCAASFRTRLDVSEGVVEVRVSGKQWRVSAGQSWPSDCPSHSAPLDASEPPAPLDEAAVNADAPVAARAQAAARAIESAPSSAAADKASDIAQQNELFGQAIEAQKRGDHAAALRYYQRLLVRYPSSALAENALVARMRLLAKHSPNDASGVARRYLERYPRGFAKQEAQRLADAR